MEVNYEAPAEADFDSDAADKYWYDLYNKYFSDSLVVDLDINVPIGDIIPGLVELVQERQGGSEGRRFGRKQLYDDERSAKVTGPGRPGRRKIVIRSADGNLIGFRLVALPSEEWLDAKKTLADHDIEDDATLILLALYSDSGMYCMIHIPGSDEMLSVIRHTNMPRVLVDDKAYPGIWGALLYTEEDSAIASYVRRYFLSLHSLSGNLLYIFVVEKSVDGRQAKEYWQRITDDRLYVLWQSMGWLNTKPYEKSRVYDIARTLGVQEDQLPCLVLFDGIARSDKLIFPIQDASPAFFRKLFASLRRAMEQDKDAMEGKNNEEPSLGTLAKKSMYGLLKEEEESRLFEQVSRNYGDIIGSLELVRKPNKQTGAAEYRFFGHTVFINHPEGSVLIQDRDKRG